MSTSTTEKHLNFSLSTDTDSLIRCFATRLYTKLSLLQQLSHKSDISKTRVHFAVTGGNGGTAVTVGIK
jgi:hypothetical protein